jgi:hypothetical protein
MRILLTIVIVFLVFLCHAQLPDKVLISGTIKDTYRIPIKGVAIINVKTGKVNRTDSKGFFETEFSAKDSVLIYHIAYKKEFINSNENRKEFILEAEVIELKEVNITEKANISNMDSLSNSATDLAKQKQLSGYDEKDQLSYFVDEKGTHNKGFSPYFGPTFKIPFGRDLKTIIKREEQRQIKEMTSHYHLVSPEKKK